MNKSSLKRSLTNDRLKCFESIAPTPSSFQLLRRQLESNQCKRVRIGFCESCRTISDYAKLCSALRYNTSVLVVEIGWELPQRALWKTLDQVARLPLLESLVLACYANIPKHLLQRLVSKPTLKRLELRNITIGYGPWTERVILTTSTGNDIVGGPYHQHLSVLADHFSDSIKSLHLIACEMEEDDINRVCEWTARKTRTRPLEELSLALSAGITPKGLETIFTRAVCRRLDLTGCRLNDSDAAVIARNLDKSKTIEDLVVSRNPFGAGSGGTEHGCLPAPTGFDDLIQAACRHLKSLDVSCCSLSKDQVRTFLHELTLTDTISSSLESLTMLGIPKGCDQGHVLLSEILRNNNVLKSLRLYPITDLYRAGSYASEESIAKIENILVDNYTMGLLQVGGTTLRMDLLLRLNRAGRHHLRQDSNGIPVDWAKVLARGSTDPDVMYWLLRNGFDQIF